VRTDYALAITEDEAALRQEERRLRDRTTAVRVRALRLLKGGAARTLGACADLVGHSPRQVARWWAAYRHGGLEALLREPAWPGKPSRLTPEALAGLEAAMAEGQMADRHGVVYASLNGVWAQLRKHQIKLKTGRRRHDLADAAAQAAFKAGFRGERGRGPDHAGLGL
jgi:transposase